MASTTWSTTVTIKNDNEAVQQMRDFLRYNDGIVPYRNGDVVAKYLRHIIDSSNAFGGIQAEVAASRPYVISQHSKGLEHEPHSLLAPPSTQFVRKLKQLASCAFGALILLALAVTFAG
ncbi:hypothetical protein [Nitrobacter vulgaris]|uniref:Uncharacterized protein n=1 Tax=Nitrobacter vulgaris TaxID=29421 RepID=A0A1V4I2K3_NITVU|nr:hypothetical protein [Nitrobacter vulgaris]OPH84364.1 hypothetical protein B2M20_02390 [Nitrobacter vulgaris]